MGGGTRPPPARAAHGATKDPTGSSAGCRGPAHGVGGVRGPANAPPPPGPLQNYAFWICIMCGNICIEAKPNTVQKHSHWEIVIDLCLLLFGHI